MIIPDNSPSVHHRVPRSFAHRSQAATRDALTLATPQIDNGDEARYSDKCGTYTRCIRQAGIGRVDLSAYHSFKKALESGRPDDFEAIQLGGARTLNGPQGGLAFDLEGLDSSQFSPPPAPALASEEYAAELVELYWATLLRDAAFTDYSSNPTAAPIRSRLSCSFADPSQAKPSGSLCFSAIPEELSDGRFEYRTALLDAEGRP